MPSDIHGVAHYLESATPMIRNQQILESPLEVYIYNFISPSLSLAKWPGCLLQGRTIGTLMGQYANYAAIPSCPVLWAKIATTNLRDERLMATTG